MVKNEADVAGAYRHQWPQVKISQSNPTSYMLRHIIDSTTIIRL